MAGDTSFPSQFLPDMDDDVPSRSQHNNNNNNVSALTLKPQAQMNDMEDDFITELTHQMYRFLLLDDDKFHHSGIGSKNSELSQDSIGSPQSTLWSPLGSSEGFSQEPSPPPTPFNDPDSCWKSTYDMTRMFEKTKLDERSNSKQHPSHEIQSFNSSNIGPCSYQSLIQEQIKAIEFSRLKQEQVLSQKQKSTAYGECQGHVSQGKEQIQQSQKKGKGCGNGRRTRQSRPDPLPQIQSQQQGGAGMRALFLGGSGSSGGTGVFLPRAGTGTPSESTKKQGKGCSTVLIPARVVQALQQHFDQMAARSGPKAGGFPPLHDVLVSNRDGMYSLQKPQSRKTPSNIQNEMILPQEWTY